MRKLLCISYLEHKTNDWVQSKINFLVDSQEPLLATVQGRKLVWFGHVTRHDSLFKTILGAPWRASRANVEWTTSKTPWTYLPMPELLTMASRRKD